MPIDRETTKILHHAQKLVKSSTDGSFTIRNSGRVEQPIPVLSSDRSLHSWFVPVTVGKVLAGFFEFKSDLTLMRYSSFQRHEDSLQGCPAAELWIDSKAIKHRISKKMHQGEKIRDFFLTYNKAPSRLVWAAVLETLDGAPRTLHVAGNVVWEATIPGSTNNAFDG